MLPKNKYLKNVLIIQFLLLVGLSCTQKKNNTVQDEDSELSNNADNQGITANASSSMKPAYGFTYYAENIIDGNLQTWWSPKSSVAFNNSISIDLNKSLDLTGFKILAGSHYPNHTKFGNIYFKNHRVKN